MGQMGQMLLRTDTLHERASAAESEAGWLKFQMELVAIELVVLRKMVLTMPGFEDLVAEKANELAFKLADAGNFKVPVVWAEGGGS